MLPLKSPSVDARSPGVALYKMIICYLFTQINGVCFISVESAQVQRTEPKCVYLTQMKHTQTK